MDIAHLMQTPDLFQTQQADEVAPIPDLREMMRTRADSIECVIEARLAVSRQPSPVHRTMTPNAHTTIHRHRPQASEPLFARNLAKRISLAAPGRPGCTAAKAGADLRRRLRRSAAARESRAAIQLERNPQPQPACPSRVGRLSSGTSMPQIIVVEKPAGLTTVRHADEVAALGKRAKKFLPPTLVDLLPAVLARAELRKRPGKGPNPRGPSHRQGNERPGGAGTHAGSGKPSRQAISRHTIGRRYLALVRGQAKDARIESHLVADRGDGRRGSGQPTKASTPSRTCASSKPLGDFTLVECELETGRTHQVRIHLGEAGTPLCGERVYDRPLHGQPLPDKSGAKRPLLHAAYLALDHPATGKRMEWHGEDAEGHGAIW